MGALLDKISLGIANFLFMHVRWNSRFRPDGAYDNSEQYCDKVRGTRTVCQQIYPNLVTNLKIPYLLYNALPGCSKYDETVYLESEPALSVRTTYKVVQIPNGRLYAHQDDLIAVITEDNKLLEDVSFQQAALSGAPEDNLIFRQQYFIKPLRYKGTVCNLLPGGRAAEDYISWLIDVLPRLHCLQQAGLLKKVDWFVVPAYQQPFQKESLRLLGIEEHKVIVAKGHFHGQADLLLAITAPRGARSKVVPQWVVGFLRSSFVKGPVDQKQPSFIYLENGPSGTRVQNEPELKALLLKYGFASCVLSEMTFQEKVRLFSSARIIVSASQIGLANLVFCREGARVVEIMDSSQVGTFYYNLSSFAGLDYHYLLSKSHRHVLNPNPPAGGGVVVETHRLRLLLDKFTGRQVRMAELEAANEPVVAVMAEAS